MPTRERGKFCEPGEEVRCVETNQASHGAQTWPSLGRGPATHSGHGPAQLGQGVTQAVHLIHEVENDVDPLVVHAERACEIQD